MRRNLSSNDAPPPVVDGRLGLSTASGARQERVPDSSGARALRVLVVEDHAATRHTLVRLLARRRHTVFAAASMTEALALAAHESFDLLLSDIGLPDGDGCALMEQLRRRQPALQGIALSGYGMDRDLRRSHEAGFSTHLIKPVDVQSLDRAIGRISARGGW